MTWSYQRDIHNSISYNMRTVKRISHIKCFRNQDDEDDKPRYCGTYKVTTRLTTIYKINQ